MNTASTIPSSEPTSLGVDNRKLGVWTFLASESVFFSALIVTYIVLRGKSVTGPFPQTALDVPLVAFNTFDLICSSLTMVSALSAGQRGKRRAMRRWLGVTALLGLVFLGGQVYEFSNLANLGLSLSRNLFGATFFTLTGFHGAHVTAGLVWIGFVLVRELSRREWKEAPFAVELVGLYWHFVDLVWIIIFTVVYLI